MRCQRCKKKPATIHITDIVGGKKRSMHLCEDCAREEGILISPQVPLNELLQNFIMTHTQAGRASELVCPECGISFAEFRERGLLGCAHDYVAFEEMLIPLLERAHEGASQHVGKVPVSAPAEERRQSELLRLRGQLKEAVGREDYERAARLRDRIRELEKS